MYQKILLLLIQIVSMSILSENIRYLRAQLGFSQNKVASDLIITRVRYAKYEEATSEPPVELLIRMSRYFHISIDLMVSADLRKIPLKEIMELPDNRILLPVKVHHNGENIIEIIPHKASMGYLSGYADPEYIENLQTISLPFLGAGTYRAFQVEGDSMPPYKDGAFIIGKYLEKATELKKGKSYLFVTRSEGITYKRLVKTEEEAITVAADNLFYEPYSIPLADIFEIWEYACSISTEEFTKEDFNTDQQQIIELLKELKKEVNELKINN